jgi:hypothetical protein
MGPLCHTYRLRVSVHCATQNGRNQGTLCHTDRQRAWVHCAIENGRNQGPLCHKDRQRAWVHCATQNGRKHGFTVPQESAQPHGSTTTHGSADSTSSLRHRLLSESKYTVTSKEVSLYSCVDSLTQIGSKARATVRHRFARTQESVQAVHNTEPLCTADSKPRIPTHLTSDCPFSVQCTDSKPRIPAHLTSDSPVSSLSLTHCLHPLRDAVGGYIREVKVQKKRNRRKR